MNKTSPADSNFCPLEHSLTLKSFSNSHEYLNFSGKIGLSEDLLYICIMEAQLSPFCAFFSNLLVLSNLLKLHFYFLLTLIEKLSTGCINFINKMLRKPGVIMCQILSRCVKYCIFTYNWKAILKWFHFRTYTQ